MDNLLTLRQKAGLTQEELAEKSGVSRVAIADIERGARKYTHTDTLLKLAAALECTPDDLFRKPQNVQ